VDFTHVQVKETVTGTTRPVAGEGPGKKQQKNAHPPARKSLRHGGTRKTGQGVSSAVGLLFGGTFQEQRKKNESQSGGPRRDKTEGHSAKKRAAFQKEQDCLRGRARPTRKGESKKGGPDPGRKTKNAIAEKTNREGKKRRKEE